MNAPVLFCNPTQLNSSAVEGKYGTKSPSPFPKNKKAPTPLGPLPRRPSPAQGPCEAGPETPRPPTGRGFSELAAPPGGRGAHTAGRAPVPRGLGDNKSPWAEVSVGPCDQPGVWGQN